ncbi:transcriptional regulator, LysR family [Pseudomonas synxantha]|uniref:LysR family transcriptional regulator n=1 Tax=Pseudomonas synxantha TaxID=47883 RepID=A0AAX3IAV1_9PSED|nr:LysR substrate-binding domain-containing protein [Pseudomonas synxantha]AZE65769.1 Glycine cleavage system transcriptional activator [Pseudomonas synxantha]KRP56720.1 LysR family transcriptional regulator [Pseudomonas synxantha]MBI6564890.1 LysR family transcriptional regulator [Pseudomonas synxantha]MBI6580690.1 LysR family transcriptional regulator [Pseudomonas synxantha]MBI6645691.1 LysR family transcriptional regulator [Pseudomonas synxantha]
MALHNDLPPLLALRAFEAVARHLSFIKAAVELSVTQSALSHQVHKLEQHLGKPLFIRRTRAIDLTLDGQHYYDQIRPALEAIGAATRSQRAAPSAGLLRIGVLASFATLWLAPRLADFFQRYPHIQVELLPAIQLANVATAEVDLAIRYGKGDWPDVQATRLMAEILSPVCSPGFKAMQAPHGALLMATSHRPFEWTDWSAHYQVDLGPYPRVMLHDYNIVVEATVAGQGIAMGRHRLIERRLQNGSLVQAFDWPPYHSEIGYWLIAPQGPLSQAAECFSQWLKQTCANA